MTGGTDLLTNISRHESPEACPVCGKACRAEITPDSQLTSPDAGEWCFAYGTLYVHEPLRWETDHSADSPDDADR